MNIANKQFHIDCFPDDIGEYCVLPGDPARTGLISEYFDAPVYVSQNREFCLYSGFLADKKVSVCSTGIGGPSAAIAMEELAACGAHTFIRVGTCGGIAGKVKRGESVIASAAVRQEGTSRQYAPIEYPAVADFDVICALAHSAHAMAYPYHVGVVQSKDSFYGQHSPGRMPVSGELLAKWEAWKKLGVLCSEMECAALFTVAAALGVRCGAVLHVNWNQENEGALPCASGNYDAGREIEIAVEALKTLILEEKV